MFIQIVEFDTHKLDEMRAMSDRYQEETEGKRTSRRVTLCKDRDEENHYFLLVEFDSYEEAMKNSELPETQALSGEMAKLGDGPPTFHNLDVVDTWEG